MTKTQAVKEPDQRRTVLDFEQEARKRTKPTDDELGEFLYKRWEGGMCFLYGNWHTYAGGVWKPYRRAEFDFWQVQIENKGRGIKPNAGKAASVEKYCRLRLLVDDDQIPVSTPYINLRNGLFNMETGELEEHRPDLYFTSQLPFEFDPAATCPTWDKFLQSVLVQDDGSTDWQLYQLVQEAFFYSLTSDTSFRVSFWLVGASGTGKSTLVNTLIMLAGDSHTTIDLSALGDSSGYQLAEVAGKRVITFSEPDDRQPLADGVYKRLVSKDPITARSPYGKPFTFVNVGKLWGSMNSLPRVLDRSDAVFNRVIIIPMNHVIPDAQRDYQLEDKLRGELAGIFNWALEIRAAFQQYGFTRAKASDQAREQYKLENDIERAFFDERLDRDAAGKITPDDLHALYQEWCKSAGYIAKGKIGVGREWRRLGLVQHSERDETGKTTRYWKGARAKK